MPQETGTLRTCTRCLTRQLIENFRFMATVGNYHSWCRECERAHAREARRGGSHRSASRIGRRRPSAWGYGATNNTTHSTPERVGYYNLDDPEDRVFGVEMELTGPDAYTIIDALTREGLNVRSTVSGYRATNGDAWELKRDGSVHGEGLELASPKLRGVEGFEQLRKACRALQSVGASVDSSCGLHVHVDFRGMSYDAIRRQVLRVLERQSFMARMIAPSRRANSYCSPWSQSEIDRFRAADVTMGSWNFGPRGTVNLHAYGSHGSVEFRAHGGTTNYSKVSAWVRYLLRALVATEGPAYELRLDLVRLGLGNRDREVLSRFIEAEDRVETADHTERDLVGANA